MSTQHLCGNLDRKNMTATLCRRSQKRVILLGVDPAQVATMRCICEEFLYDYLVR
jgi:hypothetical protein